MTSKRSSGKSILANFGAFTTQADDSEASAATDNPAPKVVMQPLARVGAGVIGATHRSLSELREERDRLQAIVETGGSIELDPSTIDPSPFPDRLQDDDDADFELFKKLMSEEGQKVPIQVRRSPSAEGRYQVVYGHRRWRAASELGIKVKATVLALSDTELVVSQGIENAARQDLSWIERALFAWRMDQAGIKARDIRAALSIDDPELARLRAVCRSIPTEIIKTIGRAPKVGRPRWVALASSMEADASALARVRKTLSADKVLALRSDERFKLVLAAVVKPTDGARKETSLKNLHGAVIGKAVFSENDIRLSVGREHATEFHAFIEAELPLMMEKFFAREGSP